MLQLLLTVLLAGPALQLRFRPPRSFAVGRLRGRRLDALPVMLRLLPLALSGLHSLQRLFLPRVRGRRSGCALLLVHPQLQRFLLLLALQLVLLQCTRPGILGSLSRRGKSQRQTAQAGCPPAPVFPQV